MSLGFISAANSACVWKTICTSRKTERSCLRRRVRVWKSRLGKVLNHKGHEGTRSPVFMCDTPSCLFVSFVVKFLLEGICHKRGDVLLQFAQRLVLDVHHVPGSVVTQADAGVLCLVQRHVVERVLG